MKTDRKDALFEVLCGTYEEFLVGYKFYNEDNTYKLEQTIADHSHRSSIRSIGAHQRYLASGGADENIHLYDLKERREGGLLMHHSGTVTALKFTPDGTHLMSGSEDGSIAIVRTGNWIMEKIWSKAHQGQAVSDLSIHPTGKIALSIGADKTLRTWNLIKGRPAYTINLYSKCTRLESISWSRCGMYFGLIDEKNVNLYSIDKGAVTKTIISKDRITCMDFLNDEKICLGDWAGNVTCYDFLTGNQNWRIEPSEEMRIKTVQNIENWLVTTNNHGKITVYELNEEPVKLVDANTSCRITCMAISCIDKNDTTVKKKKKNKNKSDIVCDPLGQNWSVTKI